MQKTTPGMRLQAGTDSYAGYQEQPFWLAAPGLDGHEASSFNLLHRNQDTQH